MHTSNKMIAMYALALSTPMFLVSAQAQTSAEPKDRCLAAWNASSAAQTYDLISITPTDTMAGANMATGTLSCNVHALCNKSDGMTRVDNSSGATEIGMKNLVNCDGKLERPKCQ